MTPETLRRLAIEALGEFGDERALRVLESAHIELDEGGGWEGSVGTMSAHRVRLVIDGAALAHMRVVPSVSDAVTAALAVAVASEPGHALLGVDTVWGLAPTHAASYRTGPWREVSNDDPTALRDAAIAYLEAAGLPRAAQRIAQARLVFAKDRLVVAPHITDSEERGAIATALAALLGDRARIRME